MLLSKTINQTHKLSTDNLTKWNIYNSTIVPVVLMFPLIIFVCMSFADMGLSLLSYTSLAAIIGGFVFIFTLYLKKKTMSKFGMLSFLTLMTLILFSFINIETSDMKNAIYMAIEIWMFQILCFYYRKRIHIIIIAATVFFSLCVYANFFHLINNPNLWFIEEEKVNTGYLLGNNYNGMGYRFILAITFSFLCLKYSWKWIFNIIPVVILSIIPLVLTGSMTSLSGIVLYVVICCIPFVKVQKQISNAILVIVILFQIIVVFSGKGLENNELVVYFVEDVLDKDITFSLRTHLWDMSLEKISESPLWGYGYLNFDWYASNIHTSVGTGPCNLILSILLNGGIIFLFLFLSMFIVSIRRVMVFQERYALFLQLGLTIIMMMHLMETLTYVFCFYLMTLAYYYPDIRNELLTSNKQSK